MDGHACFSADYRSARARFRASASARGLRLEAHPIGDRGDLTIDVAAAGDVDAGRLVIVSCGLHGVEGYLGSAIQAALLEDDPANWPLPAGVGLVLLHALDPFGFAETRRSDGENVDLNRNFLLDGEPYAGCPPKYRALDRLLNPRRPPGRLDLFAFESIVAIARHGRAELKRAIAGGQYEFPRGLFFGGHGPSPTRRLIERHLPRWVGRAGRVIHLDVHTGLGPRGGLTLLLDEDVPADQARAIAARFAPDRVEWSGEGIAYPTRGGLGPWCRTRLEGRSYEYLCAEFGTDPGAEVLAAIRAENRAHHWGVPGSASTARAKAGLREAFAPADHGWRDATVARGLAAIRRAFEAVLAPSPRGPRTGGP